MILLACLRGSPGSLPDEAAKRFKEASTAGYKSDPGVMFFPTIPVRIDPGYAEIPRISQGLGRLGQDLVYLEADNSDVERLKFLVQRLVKDCGDCESVYCSFTSAVYQLYAYPLQQPYYQHRRKVQPWLYLHFVSKPG